MCDTPCGCDLLEAAKLTKDIRARRQKQSDGEHFQKVWNCPRGAGSCQGPLPPAAQSALEAVAVLTGAEGLETCPMWYARLDWVGDVVRLRRWFQKGQLHLRVPHPSGPLVDAIDCIEDSVTLREAWEIERARTERQQTYPGVAPPAPPGAPKP